MKRIWREPTGGGTEPRGSLVSRVRHHLQMRAPGSPSGNSPEPSLANDVRALLQRLRRVHSRGGGYAGVQLSPQLSEAMKAFKIMGNELLVMTPEREGV